MATKTKVFILILNYRHYQDTLKCISALKRSNLPSGTEILVLDNSVDNISVKLKTISGINTAYVIAKINQSVLKGNIQRLL